MREKITKPPPPAPTASTVGPCPTIFQTSRTPWHWTFTQHHRSTRPPPPLWLRDQVFLSRIKLPDGKQWHYLWHHSADYIYFGIIEVFFNHLKKWVGKFSETDSYKSQISSKTSRGKMDSTKGHHQRHHRRQPGEQQLKIQFRLRLC